MMKYCLLSLLFALSLGICKAQAPKVVLGGTDTAGLMNTLFGNYNASQGTSVWICRNPAILKKFSITGTFPFSAKLLSVDSLAEGTTNVLYLMLSFNPVQGNDCHACAPALEFLRFIKVNSHWQLTNKKITDPLGSFGVTPPFIVTKIGANRSGFLFNPGYTAQGITSGGYVLVGFYNNGFRLMLDIQEASMDNQGVCDSVTKKDCYAWEGKLQIIDSNKNFNDMLLTKKGTAADSNNKIIRIDSAITYRFVNGKYTRSNP